MRASHGTARCSVQQPAQLDGVALSSQSLATRRGRAVASRLHPRPDSPPRRCGLSSPARSWPGSCGGWWPRGSPAAQCAAAWLPSPRRRARPPRARVQSGRAWLRKAGAGRAGLEPRWGEWANRRPLATFASGVASSDRSCACWCTLLGHVAHWRREDSVRPAQTVPHKFVCLFMQMPHAGWHTARGVNM